MLVLLTLISLVRVSLGTSHLTGQEPSPSAVEAARQAMQDAGRFPWYDAKADQLQPVELSESPPLRQPSNWEWNKSRRRSTNWSFGFWESFWKVVQYAVWIALAVIFAVLLYLWLTSLARRQLAAQGIAGAHEDDRRHEADLIEQLPFQLKRPQTDLLGEARRHYQQGNYREAIVYLFSYQLVQLDRHHRIQLAKGKTNRQYLFELRSAGRLRQLLTPTMLAFEDVFFGHYDLARDRFEVCWQSLDEFEQLVREIPGASPTPSSSSASSPPPAVALRGLMLALLLPLLGCQRSAEIDSTYGQRRGAGADSVNGTAVLGELFKQAGFKVSSWRRLSPKLEREDVLVWAPDRFGVPQPGELAYLESWLDAQPGRTLVFVGRDYDASRDYWPAVLPRLTAQQRLEARQRLAQSESLHASRRTVSDAETACGWFTLDPDAPALRPQALSGPWAAGVEALDTHLWLHTDLRLPRHAEDEGDEDVAHADEGEEDEEEEDDSENQGEGDASTRFDAEPLLTTGGRLLVGRLANPNWNGSKILVVANGSWLLNLPLVTPAHRMLAQQLIDECRPAERVCFLESDERGLAIAESDVRVPLMLQVFTVYPVNVLMLHVVFLGILYGLATFPIFGRPRHLPDDQVADFGKHVTAVGELLEKGQDTAYARAQLQHYRDTVQGKP